MQRKRPKKTANKRTEYIAARSYAYPVYQTWLIDTLAKAYSDRVFILGVIGDIARLIRRRQKQKREASNTTCIACGGWIPKEREERRQHTCSDNCQQWYRRLTRAIDAGRECRYCGRGLPKDRQKWPKRRRPGRPRGLRQRVEIKPGKTLGAPRHMPRHLVPKKETVPLIPNQASGVSLTAIDEYLEGVK